MSKHKTPLTELERKGLEAHGLGKYIGQPSQLADAFRQGVSWALSEAKKQKPVCWFKHGPYEGGEPLSVVFEDPQDDINYSALGYIDNECDLFSDN